MIQNRRQQLLGRTSFDQESIRPGRQGIGPITTIHRQHDDPDLWPTIFDEARGFQAIHDRHAGIYQHHVGSPFPCQVYHRLAVSRITDHLYLGRGSQQRLQSRARSGTVIGY
jgi:hypothetical protein